MITNRDVNNLLSFIPNVIGKAYVTHIYSSGMTKDQALNITISDLIEACDSAFGFTEKRTLENLLAKKPETITPMWVIKKKNNDIKIIFSSSESLFYIFIYLTERLVKNKSISLDEKLFVTGNNVLSSKELHDIFKYSEKRYVNYIGYSLTYHNLDNFDYHQFHYSSIGLRGNFKYVCGKALSNSIDDEKERTKIERLFTEGLSEEDEYFKLFSNDISKLKEAYLNIVPLVTAKNYEYKYPSYFKAEDYLFDKPVHTITKKKYPEERFNQILEDYLLYRWGCDINDDDLFVKIFVELARKENDNLSFDHSIEYLDKIMKRTVIKDYMLNLDVDFNNYNIDYVIGFLLSTGEPDYVADYLDALGIFDKFNIKEENFIYCIHDYLNVLDMNKIKRKLSKSDLADLLIESML